MVLSRDTKGSVGRTIRDRIRRRREQKEWSLPRLAEEAGVAKGYLWELENGKALKPSASTLFRIASALGTTVADLLGEDSNPSRHLKIPAALQRFAEKEGLTAEDVRMLAGVHYRGKRPVTEEDWRYVFQSIRRSVSRRRRSQVLKHAKNRHNWKSLESLSLIRSTGIQDPIEAMRVVAGNLIDRGELEGPPTDLPLLASLQGVARIESAEMNEAGRLVPIDNGLMIQVNGHDSPRRQNFTTAHELGHTLLPTYSRRPVYRSDVTVGSFVRNDEEEYLCDVGASALLLPDSWLRPRAIALGPSLGSIMQLADEFDCSLEATALAWTQLDLWACAVVFWEKALKPAELRLLNQARLSDSGELRPVPKFRVSKSFRTSHFPYYIPRFKSVDDDSTVAQAGNYGWASGAIDIILDRGVLHLGCDAEAANYKRDGGHVTRVISLLRSPGAN